MRKGPESAYDKRNIHGHLLSHIFRNGKPSHGGDRKIFEVMTST